ncbi:MAG: LemA family protein [Candidatus Omnitrophica bacterium]|nr:LemA family protein [Candidatus Omnitrophota bacterium]MCM8828754.1 LemA family protein [Candidatus Omnitrophota bacterium]
MKKKWIVTILVLLFFVIIYQALKFQYNRLIVLDQGVRQAWAQVENVIQRRADLIPNLVATVKGYAKHEKEVFIEVTNARSSLLNAKSVKEKEIASSSFEKALSRLLLVVENYPQLKAGENFLHLQDELAGTENRIAVERKRYNEAVNRYNRIAKSFPVMLFVRAFNLDTEKPYFQAEEESRKKIEVKF